MTAVRRRRLALAAGGVAAIAAGVVVLGQVVLPAIAAARLRASLRRADAHDVQVSVRALPAVKLLLGRADNVSIRIGDLRTTPAPSGPQSLGGLLAGTAASTDLDASVARLYANRIELDAVSLVKRGPQLSARATVSRAAIAAALPPGLALSLTPGTGSGLSLTASASVFGQPLSASALVQPVGGRLEVVPQLPLLDLLRITLFADPRVSVDALQVVAHGGGYTVAAQGHLT